MKPKRSYTTQKDGRRFAVEMLERIEATAGGDDHTAYPYEREYGHGEEAVPYRTGPQWDGLYKDLRVVVGNMNDEALRGFASILTDALCAQPHYMTGEYRRLEKEGRLLDFGTLGTAYPLPRILTQEETAKREARLELDRSDAAKVMLKRLAKQEQKKHSKPLSFQINNKEAEAVESFLSGHGVVRRVALAFAVQPYAEMADKIKTDKKTAQAFAEVCRELERGKSHYDTTAYYIHSAHRNIRAAILARKDGKALLKGKPKAKRKAK